jgi:hypothetical protein
MISALLQRKIQKFFRRRELLVMDGEAAAYPKIIAATRSEQEGVVAGWVRDVCQRLDGAGHVKSVFEQLVYPEPAVDSVLEKAKAVPVLPVGGPEPRE